MKKRSQPKNHPPLRDLPPGIRVGAGCLFLYPLHPFAGVSDPGVKPHYVQVSRIRDLTLDPLEPEEVEAEPLLMRSRWQVFGIEVETGAPVSFFDEYMQAIHPIDVLAPMAIGV
ncbi:MAG TPA: hypothetical protein VGM98_07900 [Schlesneria sp.]|jgi:hypothetical protein